MNELTTIHISKITYASDEVSARKAPNPKDKDYNDFLNTKEDIAKNGLLNFFSVRPIEGGRYAIVDGYRRGTALMQLFAEGRLPESLASGNIPVNVVQIDEMEALARQVAGNFHRKKMSTTQDVKALQKMAYAKGWSVQDLAKHTGMSAGHIGNILKLNFLPQKLKDAYDEGSFGLNNALLLQKLPADELTDKVDEWSAKASQMTGDELAIEVGKVLEAKREAAKAARGENTEKVFEATPVLRKKEEILLVYERAVNVLADDPSEGNQARVEALAYVLSLDASTVAEKKAIFDAEKAKRDAAKAAKEAAKKAAQEAAAAQVMSGDSVSV